MLVAYKQFFFKEAEKGLLAKIMLAKRVHVEKGWRGSVLMKIYIYIYSLLGITGIAYLFNLVGWIVVH